MKNQYFLKDKKAQVYKEIKGQQDTSGFYGDSSYAPLGSKPLWCYTKQTSMEFRQMAMALGQDEERFFVFNHLVGVDEGDYILYRDKWYQITRIDTTDDYNGDMFIYTSLAGRTGIPPKDQFIPYGTLGETEEG